MLKLIIEVLERTVKPLYKRYLRIIRRFDLAPFLRFLMFLYTSNATDVTLFA